MDTWENMRVMSLGDVTKVPKGPRRFWMRLVTWHMDKGHVTMVSEALDELLSFDCYLNNWGTAFGSFDKCYLCDKLCYYRVEFKIDVDSKPVVDIQEPCYSGRQYDVLDIGLMRCNGKQAGPFCKDCLPEALEREREIEEIMNLPF